MRCHGSPPVNLIRRSRRSSASCPSHCCNQSQDTSGTTISTTTGAIVSGGADSMSQDTIIWGDVSPTDRYASWSARQTKIGLARSCARREQSRIRSMSIAAVFGQPRLLSLHGNLLRLSLYRSLRE